MWICLRFRQANLLLHLRIVGAIPKKCSSSGLPSDQLKKDIIAHSQREKQMLLAMLFSTSKCEKSKAKVEMWPLLKHSYSEVEHVPLLLLLISTSLTKVHTGE